MVKEDSCTLWLISDHFKNQEMCNEVMRTMPNAFYRIHDHFKTLELCDEAVEVDPWQLKYVPEHKKCVIRWWGMELPFPWGISLTGLLQNNN